MNPSEFNNNFPSFERSYNKEKQEKDKELMERKIKQLSEEFSKKFPSLSFDDLKLIGDEDETDDECTHYIHTKNGLVYSWNYIENMWEDI